jgi:hypothetical protein
VVGEVVAEGLDEDVGCPITGEVSSEVGCVEAVVVGREVDLALTEEVALEVHQGEVMVDQVAVEGGHESKSSRIYSPLLFLILISPCEACANH